MTPQEKMTLQQALKELEAVDHHIAYQKAAAMVKAFKEYVDTLLPKAAGAEQRPSLPECITFHKSAIQEILDKPGCVALRMYPAINEEKTFTMVLVGVDGEGENLMVKPTPPDANAKSASVQSLAASPASSGVYDEGQKCPPYPKSTIGFD